MRVLQFYRTSFPDTMGGIEQVIHQIARGASKLGVKTDVLSLTAARHAAVTELDGYRVQRARLDLQIASTGISVSAFRRFADLARQADLIHYHFPWPFMDLVHFATRIDKPTLVTYHSDIVRQKQLLRLYRPLKTRFLASMDRIVTTSPNYLATSDVLRKYAGKVSVIPIGLDKASYPLPDPQLQQAWRARFGARFFLFVGVIRYYKGLHILLEAARASDYPIVIVGAGPVEQELKDQAAQLGLRNVHFLGHMSDEDKVALLSLCTAVVFPSHLRSEAFGISLLEGAMFGKPMISSEIGTGTSYINIAGETGLVVPPNDPQALHEAMRELWEHPEQAAQMGARAEERYWKYFTAATMARSYVGLYSELVRKHRAPA
jgi:glycosyltransferase involved in cell wall biosynthesis